MNNLNESEVHSKNHGRAAASQPKRSSNATFQLRVTPGDKEKKPGKPLATLTKKAFAQIQEHIAGNLTHTDVESVLCVVADAIRLSTGFDPEAKSSPELVAKQLESQRRKAETNGNNMYEQYMKPRREALKQKYPNVPTTILFKKSLGEVEKYAASQKA